MRNLVISAAAITAGLLVMDHVAASQGVRETAPTLVINRDAKGDFQGLPIRIVPIVRVTTEAITPPVSRPAPVPTRPSSGSSSNRLPDGCEPAASPLSPSGKSPIGARCLT